ncbi:MULTISPECIES: hypothetical protein [Pasteurellaceae]|uniref:Transmembrane protein n=1 Tax=Pasteurella atlantica TaxID=2827233 RepID=A0AAW8CLU3_9PAST|nr:hypothetical protein [Pasteurella atlantica]MBR0572669.1 hypothetical protein [Pasteurella atlantica]MDP8038614.1 hypothetical protein [Pasteurella atlantica]MDP8040706.1 hypothetical protein [Pasteurella atlantica]MDP8042841.1 hypothetical protein [Pasteurella atlantica]MDP8044928.1 hypothetical protein [Pasteurella atlantica]
MEEKSEIEQAIKGIILFVLASLVGIPLLLIAIPVLYLIALFQMPSIVNIIITSLFAFLLRKKIKRKLSRFLTFIFISFLLGINIRLPSVINDIYLSRMTSEKIVSKLDLPYGTKVKLNSNITLIYKSEPLESSVTLGGNEGCMCTYYLS